MVWIRIQSLHTVLDCFVSKSLSPSDSSSSTTTIHPSSLCALDLLKTLGHLSCETFCILGMTDCFLWHYFIAPSISSTSYKLVVRSRGLIIFRFHFLRQEYSISNVMYFLLHHNWTWLMLVFPISPCSKTEPVCWLCQPDSSL